MALKAWATSERAGAGESKRSPATRTEIQLLLLHQRHQALNHRNSNLFEAGAVIGINDPAIGLTDLPVRCAKSEPSAEPQTALVLAYYFSFVPLGCARGKPRCLSHGKTQRQGINPCELLRW